MKINIQIAFVIVLLFIFQNTNAQEFIADSPSPAEIEARDKPLFILQNEIEDHLCNNDFGITDPFLFFKDQPDTRNVARGASVHNFSLILYKNNCTVSLKATSPLYSDYVNNSKVLNERLTSIINSAPTQAEAYNDAMKNKGVLPAKDKELLAKKKIAKDKCFNEMTQLSNKTQLAKFFLSINNVDVNAFDLGDEGFNIDKVNEVKHISIPGARQVLIGITYPEEDNPDTTYTAQVYIGNWPKLEHHSTPFPFKYKTKTAWIDKAHSGPPIIENIRIRIATYSYDKIMKVIQGIDWTKLETLIKK